jgi:L-fuculose-phosphate aldolase
MDENRECGIRYKFVPVARDRRPNRHPEMDRLLYWCDVFDREGMAPLEGGASAGNLSFRTLAGFVITPTRSLLKAGLPWERLVEVVRSNWLDFEIHYLGDGPPSSDSFLHGRIYAMRPDVNAVLHGHDDVVLAQADALPREFDIAVTPTARLFGTKEDAEETARDLGAKSYIIRRGHGFIAVGRTLDEAGELALKVHRRAVELAKASTPA